jgi:hypothetical protein
MRKSGFNSAIHAALKIQFRKYQRSRKGKMIALKVVKKSAATPGSSIEIPRSW